MTNLQLVRPRRVPGIRWWFCFSVVLALVAGVMLGLPSNPDAQGPCGPPVVHPIACENSKPGNPASEWDISGAGDPSIQGFATDISVNRGGTVRFKIATNASAYRLDIYRVGYYGGMGARKVATVLPSAALPQNQPACLTESTTGLTDCGNWQESARWTVPATATSGIYFARLVRTDTGGDSHVVFVVRDDSSQSDLLFKTSDTTWQAYNAYGGNSLYVGSPAGRAYKVSYNRPFSTRSGAHQSWLFDAEYPMVRWLEKNGYDVSYCAGVDVERLPATILQHGVLLSVGHDEYWSAGQRASVTSARDAGVHLAFFSGNEMFWKTRWEPSIDGSGAAFRTLVSYKETHANAKIDPLPNVWTGTWRDPRFSPPADGGRPENALTGTLFMVNCCRQDSIQVPEPLGKLRFWRNTSVATLAPGQTATVGAGLVGYEWDEAADNGFQPPGLVKLSSSTLTVSTFLSDFGSTYGTGVATHSLTMYRHASGALVFGAGTIRWSWGLDENHDSDFNTPNASNTPDGRMQQATVNLFADMGAQPATLQTGLVLTAASTDTVPPTSTITSPASGATVQPGSPITISGTAADAGGGVVALVQISTDGGATWHPATGRTSWTFSWTPIGSGNVTIASKAVDDSGNIQTTATTVTVNLVGGAFTIWPSTATPAIVAANDPNALEVGVKFRADVNGFITGLRFYKGAQNTGTHVGHLWSATGSLLASVTFTGESAAGWQQANFASPVAITANTIYVASYHSDAGFYSVTNGYFNAAGVDNPPLHALATAGGPNGVYRYGASAFPDQTFNGSNYWVDVVFTTTQGPDTSPPTVTGNTPASGATGVAPSSNITVTFNEPMNATTISSSTFELRDAANAVVPAAVSYASATRTATLDPIASLAAATTYTVTVRGGATDPRVKDVANNALASNFTWSFTTGAASSGCPCTIWPSTATPAIVAANDANALEIGVKFRADVNGFITGLRFYKGAQNTGTHVGHLWSATGSLLASVTFTGESAAGWQQANFAAPVAITANAIYVASYHTDVGFYALTAGYFNAAGVDSPPLHALATTGGPNGVYRYGASAFPDQTFNGSNYWVDVVFTTTQGPDTSPPTVTGNTPASGATGVAPSSNITVTFNEPMNATTITSSTFELRTAANTVVPATVSYASATRTATLDPTASLAAASTYTVTVRGGATDPRVKDVANNALASNFTWSFTTGAASSACPCTIWPSSATPDIAAAYDLNALEVGVKFRADVNGFITGLRFYKGADNTGTHVGHLWSATGALLASVTFTGESAAGWQQANFATPVAITANTIYVASYHTDVGFYSLTAGYFNAAGVDNPPLHALATTSSPNGVYRYGASAFPDQTFNGGNYWVDVVFTPGP
jgi:hypothetical protein